MRRLRGGVNDEVDVVAVRAEEGVDLLRVPDVDPVVQVVVEAVPQLSYRPLRGRLGPEEARPHVVVDADDGIGSRCVEARRFRPDETPEPDTTTTLIAALQAQMRLTGAAGQALGPRETTGRASPWPVRRSAPLRCLQFS